VFHTSSPQQSQRFYRTYEELKLSAVGHIDTAAVRFYRTYEELKLQALNALPATGGEVFIVPMRN